MSIKDSNDASWDRTSDLPNCSTAPQPLCYPTAVPYALSRERKIKKIKKIDQNCIYRCSRKCACGNRGSYRLNPGVPRNTVCLPQLQSVRYLKRGKQRSKYLFSGLSFEPWIYHEIMRSTHHYTVTVVEYHTV